jgi:hypothetical protein
MILQEILNRDQANSIIIVLYAFIMIKLWQVSLYICISDSTLFGTLRRSQQSNKKITFI